jgi:tetratricopeptide (TPR) repeat protein
MLSTWSVRAAAFVVVAVFSQATEAQLQDVTWCANQGNQFSDDQQITGCIAAIQSGRWSGKNLAEVFNNLGNAYKAKGDRDRAIAVYTEAVRLNPKDSVLFFNRGNAYNAKGDYDRAITDYTEVIRLDPHDPDPTFMV